MAKWQEINETGSSNSMAGEKLGGVWRNTKFGRAIGASASNHWCVLAKMRPRPWPWREGSSTYAIAAQLCGGGQG